VPVLQITDDGFRLDGEPFRILSGGLHYFRVHPELWADRLRKARLMGLNTVETYVPWNLHEPRPGVLDLEGLLDLPRFLRLAAEEGLHVLLRPGPYICAEWEGGGLPAWLLAEPGIRLRSTDPGYLAAMDGYFAALLPHLLPFLGTRGGPVLAVQVENEFGAYGQDQEYLRRVADALTRNGVDVPLFTSDQPADLERGGLDGVLRTANFGSRPAEGFAALRRSQPTGPLMCAEFWIGWFDRWGGVHATRAPHDAARTLEEMLAAGASVNFYMFHGGTNFGFTNGANDKGHYRATLTSYDYGGAPLDECGDPTPAYTAFREVIGRYAPLPDEPLPTPGRKLALPGIRFGEVAPLLENAAAIGGEARPSARPLAMEELGQSFGFVLYETVLPSAGPALLHLPDVRDRAQLFVDGQPVGVLSREDHERALACQVPREGARLTVLVENQGRVNYGQGIHDRKGLLGEVTLDGEPLSGWTSRPLPLDDLTGLNFKESGEPAPAVVGPAFHRAEFEIDEPADTFLALPGWTKGNAWINGFPLGRYWSRGPQQTLYVPGPVLRRGRNELIVLELHATPARVAELRERPDLGPTEE
jgi:beta-galactosidase